MSRVIDILKHKDKGLSVDEARKAMLDAGEAPRGVVGEVKKNLAVGHVPSTVIAAPPPATGTAADILEPTLEIEVIPPTPAAVTPAIVPAIIAPTAVASVITPPVPERPKIERVETDEFSAELRQEGGKWVGEIQYKNGSGTERFSASTKNELMLELLKGKGHATLRVKQAVRREKLGGPKLDRAYPLPEGFTTEEFEALPEKQQGLVIETIAAQQSQYFCSTRADYHQTEKNAALLQEFLQKNNLPYTFRNLEYAFEDLTEDGLLEARPKAGAEKTAPPEQTLTTQPAVTRAEDSAPAPATPAPASPAPAVKEAPAAPAVRMRGTSGLQPGASSLPTNESAAGGPGGEPRDLSDAELKKLPMAELKRIADADRRARAATR